MVLEDGLAEFVTFDREFRGFADGRAQGPVTAAAGPDGDKGGVWGYAFFKPVTGAVEEGRGCEGAVAVGGSGGDLAFDSRGDADGVHGSALACLCRMWKFVWSPK